MPLKAPRQHARKHHRLSSIAEGNAKGLVVWVFRSVIIAGDMTVDGWLADHIGHEVITNQHLLEALRADQQ
ncbi:hypothetical protein MP631_06975 [Xanthomonas phaseoli pv. phaseoli]|nr:hypothetical protein MP631_06975 [Xanthomonas phaseoli pv. phaseoli]